MERLRGWPQIATLFVLALALGYLAWLGWGLLPGGEPSVTDGFDGTRALALTQDICDIGPRPVGSPENDQTADLILEELRRQGWKTAEEDYTAGDMSLRNVAGLAGGEEGPLLVIATHYDSRSISDGDAIPSRRNQPSPGANDGASGVAVLLELARAVDVTHLQHRVWLIFLDGEAEAGLPSWKEASGATQFVDGRHPDAIIYLNMVGAADAVFPQLPDVDQSLQTQLWELAAKLGFDDRFVSETGPIVKDAHLVFLQADIPTVEIIQPDYPYARSTEDTCDKLDAATLLSVGALLESYLENNDFADVASSLKDNK